MIFRQIIHDDLGCASHLIGDGKAGIAAVVDPRLGVDEYLGGARYMGVSIEHKAIVELLHSRISSWRQERRAVEGRGRVPVGELVARSAAHPRLRVLDVREQREWDDGHIPGVLSTPWHDVAFVPESLDASRPTADTAA